MKITVGQLYTLKQPNIGTILEVTGVQGDTIKYKLKERTGAYYSEISKLVFISQLVLVNKFFTRLYRMKGTK